MKASIRSTDLLFKKAIYLQKQGIPFKLIGVNGSYNLLSDHFDGVKYMSKFKQGLTPEDLGFVKRVKNYVIKNEIYLNFTEYLTPSMIKYVDMMDYPDGTILSDVYEIDIDEAYWKTAHLKKIISDQLYEEGSKKNIESGLTKEEAQYKKRVRLIALGALAKKRSVYSFTGRRIVLQQIERSELTELIWYSICKEIADIMQRLKCKLENNFIMYWVDGIYVIGQQNANEISAMIEKCGYGAKIKKIEKVVYKERTIFVYDTKKEFRTFKLPKVKFKKTTHNQAELNRTAIKHSKL